MAEIFPEDITIEILLRLPVKSLMRFKCVDKRWRSLISKPGFAKLHLQRLKAGDLIPSQRIFKTDPLETIDYEGLDGDIDGDVDSAVVKVHELRMDHPCWEPYLVGSCDGLVCLRCRYTFLLYNPTTKESTIVPGSNLFGLPLFIGFGYDSRSDDYKIVQGDLMNKRQAAIFSLKSGSWRRTQVQQESLLAVSEAGVYWNGALHWCVIDKSRNRSENVITSFDLSDEKFQQVLSVPEVDQGIVFNGLGVHGANLFVYHGTILNECFEVWITNDYRRGGSWTKLFSVWTNGMIVGTNVKIPAYTRSGKIVFQTDMDQMRLFNPKDNTYKDYPIHSHGNGNVESAIYLETLVSPYVGCEPSRI